VRPRPASIVPSWVVYGFQFIGVGAWTAYATVYFEQMGIDLAAIGVLAAVPAAVAILAAPAWGLVADRLGDMRVPYLVAGLWAASAGVALATGPAMPWLGLVVLALSVGAAGMSPLIDARTIQRLWPRRERFGLARAAGSVAFMVGTIGTGRLIAASDLRVMFVVYALAMSGAGVAALLLLGRPRIDAGEKRVTGLGPLAALGLLHEPGLGLFFAGSAVMWIAAVGAMTLFSLRILELGGDAALVGIGWATSELFEVPFMVLFGRLARRIAVERLVVVGALLFVVRGVLWSQATSPVALIALTSLGGSGYALVLVGTATYISRRSPAQLQATAQALFAATTFSIGSIVGAVLAGQIAAAAGLWAVYPVGAVGSAVGAVMVWWAIAREPAAPAAPSA
jgi:PPP family 3-phenylpropionic acid transporter